jgi:RNA polymerase sigma-70 factor (ECF subfamily)
MMVPDDDETPGRGGDERRGTSPRPATPRDDQVTFEEFFTARHDAVLRSVAATIGDREVAVDATQDAFIKAHARWSTLRTYDAPDAWVRRIAINVSRDRLRSDRRRRDREASVAPTVVPDVTERFAADAGANDLLADLAPRQREVAELFYVEDRSIEEISDRLGLTTGAVKFHLARARDRLRRTSRP